MTPFDYCQSANRVLDIEIAALQGLRRFINAEFTRACELLLACQGKVVVMGLGKSGHIGRKIAATFASTGTPSFYVHPGEASHGDLGMVSPQDVVIAISNSGESDEILALFPVLKRWGNSLICLTGNPDSTMAKEAAVHLCIQTPQEACPLGLAPTSSTTAMLVMGDALAMALVEARHFTARDFAKRHPGGSLGRALLTRVSDIMRRGEEMAMLPETASVNDCLKAMTTAHAGACVLLTEDRKLAGIFTHGDFVRAYGANPLIGEQPVSGFMTRNPIYVMEDDLAAEAAKAVSNRHIDDLVVLNAEMAPVGIIDLQDLARLKLV